MDYYDPMNGYKVSFKKDSMPDMFYFNELKNNVYPESKNEGSALSIISEPAKAVPRSAFGILGSLSAYISQQAHYASNRPMTIYGELLRNALAKPDDEENTFLDGLKKANLGTHIADVLKQTFIDAPEEIPEEDKTSAQNMMKAIEAHTDNITQWFEDRQASTKLLGVELTAPDPDLFRGDFMDNPSFTRAISAVTAAIPSLAGVAMSTIVTGTPLPAIAVLGMSTAGSVTKEALDAGADPSVAKLSGFAGGLVDSLLEFAGFKMLGMNELAKDATKTGVKAAVGKPLLRRALRAGKGMITEGSQEGIQQLAQNIIARIGYDDTRELFAGVAESIIGGAGSGGIVGAIMPDTAGKLDKIAEKAKKLGVAPETIDKVYSEVANVAVNNGTTINEAISDMLGRLKVSESPEDQDLYKTISLAETKSRFEEVVSSVKYKKIDTVEEYAKTEVNRVAVDRLISLRNVAQTIKDEENLVSTVEFTINDMSDSDLFSIWKAITEDKQLNYSIEDVKSMLKDYVVEGAALGYQIGETITINPMMIKKHYKDLQSFLKDDSAVSKYSPILKGEKYLGLDPKEIAGLYKTEEALLETTIHHEIGHELFARLLKKKDVVEKLSRKEMEALVNLEEALVQMYALQKQGLWDSIKTKDMDSANKFLKHMNSIFESKGILKENEDIKKMFSEPGIKNAMEVLMYNATSYEALERLWHQESDLGQFVHAVKMNKMYGKVKAYAKKNKMSVEAAEEQLTYIIDYHGKPNPLDGTMKTMVENEEQEITVREAIKLKYPEHHKAIISSIEQNYELSQKPDAKLRALANEVSKEYKKYGVMLKKAGLISDTITNYTSRKYVRDPNAVFEGPEAKGKKRSEHFQGRVFENTAEAIANGYIPETMSATKNLFEYGKEITDVIANMKFYNTLSKFSHGLHPFLSKYKIEGYAKLDSGIFSFAKRIGGDKTYKQMYAPKQYAKSINAMLGKSKLEGIPFVDSVSTLNANLKSMRLLSSLFHHVAFFNSYVFGVQGKYKHGAKALNPFAAYKEGLNMISGMNPTIKLGVKNGLTFGLVQDWDAKLLREKTWIGSVLNRQDVTKSVKDKILNLRDTYTDFLFNKWGAGLKSMSFSIEYQHYRANPKFANMSDDQVAAMVAEFVNDDFGGLHLKRMHRNPTTQHIMRLLTLGSDWTESNINTMVKAFRLGKEGEIYRRFWGGAAMKIAIVTTLFNMAAAMIGRDDDDEDKQAFERYLDGYATAWEHGKLNMLKAHIDPMFELFGYKTNNEHYLNVGGHFLDPIKWFTRDIKKGKDVGEAFGQLVNPNRLFSGLAKSAYYKSSMVAKPIMDMLKGTDYTFYRKFTDFDELIGSKSLPDKPGTTRTRKWLSWNERPTMVGFKQLPSYMSYELYQTLPVFIASTIEFIHGESNAIDYIPKLFGLSVDKTYNKPKYKSKKTDYKKRGEKP